VAAKKENGHDPLPVEMVELLRQIVVATKDTNAKVGETNQRLDATIGRLDETIRRLDVLHHDVVDLRAEVHDFKEETRAALSDLDRRVEKMGDRLESLVLDQRREDLAGRVARLEAAVFKPAAE
jgi:uncharacterized protein YPO0396